MPRIRPKSRFSPRNLVAPRPKARYSDTSFILPVKILEAVAGRPLREIHAPMLCEPMSMRRTFFAGDESQANPKPIRSVKGIYSTAAQMNEFLRRLMSGNFLSRYLPA